MDKNISENLWHDFYKKGALELEIPKMTVYQSIIENNRTNPHHIALEYFGAKISYKTLFNKTDLCAKALAAMGVKCGHCVCVCSTNTPETIYLLLAASKLGVLLNFVNPLFTCEQKIERINDTNTEILFVLDKMYGMIKDALKKTCIKKVVILSVSRSLPLAIRCISKLGNKAEFEFKHMVKDNINHIFYDNFLNYHNSTKYIEENYCKDSPMIMVYSSGTTGASKGIVLTNDGINATIRIYKNK